MEVLKKILNIVIDIFIVIVVILSAIIAIVSISSRDSGVPDVFGYVPFTVQSNSMSPSFEEGDLIVGKRVKEKRDDYKVGDVVTFWTILQDDNGKHSVLNTHRIAEVQTNPDSGHQIYITKGDNNSLKDESTVSGTDIVAVWGTKDVPGIRIQKLGSVLAFLRKPSGFFVAVVIPMILFFIYELVRFITNFMNYNKQKAKEAALEAAKQLMGDDSSDSSGLSEEQKAQAILDFLEKQKAEQAAAGGSGESEQAKEAEQPAQEAVTQPEQGDAASEASENADA